MPSWDTWREVQDFDRLLETLDGPRILWIHRPILLHDRSNNGAVCLCGCNSRRAVEIDRREHIDLLVSTISGARVLLTPEDSEEKRTRFHEIAKRAKRVDAPIRCYDKQLPFILDRRHKIQVFFGGARGGKTSAGVEWFADAIYLLGGPGAQLWWVAPTREKTHIGVRKLVLGEKTDRSVRPVIPREMILSHPKNWRTQDQVIRLIDGTQIYLKYGGRDGGNLKGDPAQRIFIDELCELDHDANFQICLDRLTDSGGQLGGATTPIAGHWAKEKIADKGLTYKECAVAEAEGKTVHIIAETASAFDNPFQDPAEVMRRVEAGGGKEDPKIRREVYGEWVGAGPTMWPDFWVKPQGDPRTCHLESGPWRDVHHWGLVNVGNVAARNIFPDLAEPIKDIGGMDFNIWPMSTLVAQVAVPQGLDQNDPANWILFVMDEVIKRGTVHDFAHFLATKAGAYRKLEPNHFAGLKIICDATGAQHNPPESHGLTQRASTLASAMNDKGFDCRPCHYSAKGNPVNPSKMDQVSLLHKLMRDRIKHKGKVWPRLVVHSERCHKLIHGLQTQESDDKGLPLKESGTASDRLSGPIDALLYLAWGVFASHDIYGDEKTEIVAW